MTDASSDVQTEINGDTVSATATVAATPAAVFDFLRRPANHPVISGDHTVKGVIKGPETLSDGDRFGMSMRMGVPYRVSSKVVEFEPDRLLAWCHLGGHRWRWQLEPVGAEATRVTETYDQSCAKVPLLLRVAGYPKKHEANVKASVANLVAHFAKP